MQVKSNRIQSIDLLRGLVMVIMALDHVRDYFHLNAFAGNDPSNIDTTTPILFFTRFITHYCAPIFVFLAGTSAFLYGQKVKKKKLSKFLITRGLWLIFIEVVVNNLLWWFDVTYGFINLQVLWAIGFSMIILGVLIYLPKKLLLILGLIIVFGHNLLDNITFEGNSFTAIIWYALHQMNGFAIGSNRFLWFSYPALAWIGVIILGYCFGQLYAKDIPSAYRKKCLLILGIGSILLFLIIRFFNFYGNPTIWSNQETVSKTIMSFLHLQKYPPSLSFLLVTLGPAFLFLYTFENTKNKIVDFLLTFGRVPFFYYLLHVLVIHLVALIGLIITGGNWKLMILNNETMQSGLLKGYGYSLTTVYLVWIFIILLLYPICRKYMIYKANNKDKWWLSYL